VIYLLDEKRNVLVQKAAWGPKTTDENKILNPIEISLGKGIVGVVAKTGKAEIISDTSKDDRYIVDDVRRFSEIAVPVVSDGRVLGVIDSENSRKNYFTQRHLSILTTIASLCANKIVRARAEEEKQKAEKNLSETERQTAEMEMQALRAQMNPHFMFNSLNSINNFILKNDSDNASQYLTRFSRLMRLILDNSREDWVLLENEIKALELYIEMEAIRFDNVFEHSIKTAFDINTSAVMVPPMIVQPYVENAIWHGLLHRKEPGSKLLVDIWKKEDKLFIKVEDNGVGRQEAQLLKVKFSSHKKSHGMRITAKRLEIVNKIYKVDAKVHMEDLKNGEGMPAGTSVTLEMKYKTNHGE
jgi:LytS/YehU family sensor histidine kinase